LGHCEPINNFLPLAKFQLHAAASADVVCPAPKAVTNSPPAILKNWTVLARFPFDDFIQRYVAFEKRKKSAIKKPGINSESSFAGIAESSSKKVSDDDAINESLCYFGNFIYNISRKILQ
jgi:hypothetical protein